MNWTGFGFMHDWMIKGGKLIFDMGPIEPNKGCGQWTQHRLPKSMCLRRLTNIFKYTIVRLRMQNKKNDNKRIENQGVPCFSNIVIMALPIHAPKLETNLFNGEKNWTVVNQSKVQRNISRWERNCRVYSNNWGNKSTLPVGYKKRTYGDFTSKLEVKMGSRN